MAHRPARWPMEWLISREERRVAAPLDYLRSLATASLAAFFRFARLRRVGWYRRVAHADAYAVSRLTVDLQEGCGPCMQIAVNLALQDGADLAVVRAMVAHDIDALPRDLELVHQWTRAVLGNEPQATQLGEQVELALGPAARAEIAIGMSVGRVFPMVRRAMGHADECSLASVPAPGGLR